MLAIIRKEEKIEWFSRCRDLTTNKLLWQTNKRRRESRSVCGGGGGGCLEYNRKYTKKENKYFCLVVNLLYYKSWYIESLYW